LAKWPPISLGDLAVLTRRTVLAASAATGAVPAIRTGARAATPKGVAVAAGQSTTS
jgi:hypothetical protein